MRRKGKKIDKKEKRKNLLVYEVMIWREWMKVNYKKGMEKILDMEEGR